MRQILDEQHKSLGSDRQIQKTLVPCPQTGHPYWTYVTRRFIPSHGDGTGGGCFVNDPAGFAHSGSPAERFARAASQVQARPLDLEPGVAAELADLAKLKEAFPAIFKKLVLAIAAGEREFPGKHKPVDKQAGKPVPPTFDAGQVSVSLSVCREAPRGLGLTEPEIQAYLSKFTHGSLGDLGDLVPFDELPDAVQWAPPQHGPAAEASAAVKFGSGLITAKFDAYDSAKPGSRRGDYIRIGTLLAPGSPARTLIVADRDNVDF